MFFKDETIKQVNVPTINGVFGILPQHVPTLAVLQPGVVSVVVNDSETKNIFGKLVKEKKSDKGWYRIQKSLFFLKLIAVIKN